MSNSMPFAVTVAVLIVMSLMTRRRGLEGTDARCRPQPISTPPTPLYRCLLLARNVLAEINRLRNSLPDFLTGPIMQSARALLVVTSGGDSKVGQCLLADSLTGSWIYILPDQATMASAAAEEELPPSKLGTKEHWDSVYE